MNCWCKDCLRKYLGVLTPLAWLFLKPWMERDKKRTAAEATMLEEAARARRLFVDRKTGETGWIVGVTAAWHGPVRGYRIYLHMLCPGLTQPVSPGLRIALPKQVPSDAVRVALPAEVEEFQAKYAGGGS